MLSVAIYSPLRRYVREMNGASQVRPSPFAIVERIAPSVAQSGKSVGGEKRREAWLRERENDVAIAR